MNKEQLVSKINNELNRLDETIAKMSRRSNNPYALLHQIRCMSRRDTMREVLSWVVNLETPKPKYRAPWGYQTELERDWLHGVPVDGDNFGCCRIRVRRYGTKIIAKVSCVLNSGSESIFFESENGLRGIIDAMEYGVELAERLKKKAVETLYDGIKEPPTYG